MMSLTYTRDFQIKMLVNLLADKKWFGEVASSMHLTDFDVTPCRLVFEIARTYYEKFSDLPPASVIQLEVERAINNPMTAYDTVVQDQELEALLYVMRAVMARNPADIAVDYYRHELRGYLSHVRMSQLQGNANQLESTEEHIANIVKLHDELGKIGDGESITFMDAMDAIEELQSGNACRVGTGLYTIDNMINGGLKSGQLGMLVAASGVGKTTGMLNFGVNAAIRGVHSLTITLENPGTMILGRFQSLMANIDIQLMSKPLAEWPQPSIDRLRYVNSPGFKFRNMMKCVDRSTKTQRVGEIDTIVGRWRDWLKSLPDYNQDNCAVVYVDWLEKLDPTGTPGINKNTPNDVVWQKVLEYLGEIARRHGVQMWTATQATRGALGKEIIESGMIAHSIHTLDPLDLAIGLAPVNSVKTTGVDARGVKDDDAGEQPPCDRMMNASFLKARESPVAGKVKSFYQGKTLRFWPNPGVAALAFEMAESGRLDELYTIMEKPQDYKSTNKPNQYALSAYR